MAIKQLDTFTCPNCGGKLEHKGNGYYECPYCDSQFRDDSVPQSTGPEAGDEELPIELKPATTENIKDIVLDVLEEYLEDTADEADALSIGEYPEDHPRLRKACSNFGIPDDAEVWLIWDETFFGGCKYGFAFTSKGIFSNYKENGGRVSMTWQQFKDCKIKGETYTVHLNKTELSITGGDAYEPILDATEEIQECFLEELDW